MLVRNLSTSHATVMSQAGSAEGRMMKVLAGSQGIQVMMAVVSIRVE
jgi:hypothetical protein